MMLRGSGRLACPSKFAVVWMLTLSSFTFKRVRTRVVMVVVVVRELLFLVTSLICMRIRGRGQRLPQLLTTIFVQIFV